MSTRTVHVSNIASATDDKEIHDFFSFCGKIATIDVEADKPDSKKATVVFEKDTARKTALLLNNTQLGSSKISVVSDASVSDEEGLSSPCSPTHDESGERQISQEEKPRSRIFAEYLAHGYVVGDAALEKAIELDQKHGVLARFAATLQQLDQKYHATDRARATDESYGITARGKNLLSGIGSYFERAANSPTGQQLINFYTASSRQVQDIHNEARRLADLKKVPYGGNAAKAAGLERVFGSEKKVETPEDVTSSASSTAPAPAPGL